MLAVPDPLPNVTGSPRVPPVSLFPPVRTSGLGLDLFFPVPLSFPMPSGTLAEQDGLPASAAGAGDEPEAGPSTIPLARASGDATGPTPIPTGSQGEGSEAVAAPILSYEAALNDSPDFTEWLRRESLSLEGHQAAGSFPGSPLVGTRAIGAESAIDSDSDDEDPLLDRRSRSQPEPNLILLRRHSLAEHSASTAPTPPPPETDPNATFVGNSATIDMPLPPGNALPAYSPHLAYDVLRLISTVHLDQNHPSAAFFSAVASSSVHAAAEAPMDSQPEQSEEWEAGTKKLDLTLTRGACRSGPLSVKLGRKGMIEGRIEVGKVRHGTALEIMVLGMVNTSYYVRGQYKMIDTVPLTWRTVKLYPPGSPVEDGVAEAESPSSPGSPHPTSPNSPTAALPTESTFTSATVIHDINGRPLGPTVSKGGHAYLNPGMVFPFSVTMPHKHRRDATVNLPPSCQVYQVGMRASVEYLLRVRLTRRGWRISETLNVPITYEPRPYLSTRRLRALTVDDTLNPGWRTIRLNGGGPWHKLSTQAQDGDGVEAALLLPSPPILYVSEPGADPPPIPFHLHFHSTQWLPLSTFSDPRESDYVVRLMRVATMRIGVGRIRRMEIPSKVDVLQEGEQE